MKENNQKLLISEIPFDWRWNLNKNLSEQLEHKK